MNVLQIPIDAAFLSQTFQIELDATTYGMTINWLDRDSRWYLSLFDSLNNPLVQSIPLCLNVDLLGKYTEVAIPPGTLFIFDTSNLGLEPTISDFGTRVHLLYKAATS